MISGDIWLDAMLVVSVVLFVVVRVFVLPGPRT